MNRIIKPLVLGLASAAFLFGLAYIAFPGFERRIDHWRMGVEVIESPGAKFVAYRIVDKGDWHDKRFDSSTGSFHENGAWIYFQSYPPITQIPQINSEKDFQKGVYALAETSTGENVPLQIKQSSGNKGIIAVSLPARFPPTLNELSVTLFDRERVLSKVHLNKLPRTVWRTEPDAKPNAVYQSGTIKVTGTAHVESPKLPSGWSWLIYRLNISGLNTSKNWRITNFRAMEPYQNPNAPKGMTFGGGSVSFELLQRQSYATAQWAPYNSMVKRLVVECSMDRFESREETVDFGIAQVKKDTNPNSNYPEQAFYLALTKPIVKVLKNGTKLTLTPLLNSKEQNTFHSGKTLYIRLSAEPASPAPTDGSLLVEYQLALGGRGYFSTLFPATNSTMRLPDLRFIDWEKGDKQIHIKVRVQTSKRLEHHPISLTLPVEPLPKGAIHEMSYPGLGYTQGSSSIN